MKCKHCGEEISFLKITDEFLDKMISACHSGNLEVLFVYPDLAEIQKAGGWWYHTTGDAHHLRLCAFGANLEDSIRAYKRFGDARAEPESREVAA
jgi:hypothetical protein